MCYEAQFCTLGSSHIYQAEAHSPKEAAEKATRQAESCDISYRVHESVGSNNPNYPTAFLLVPRGDPCGQVRVRELL